MTADVVALLHRAPSREVLLRALMAQAPHLRVGTLAQGGVLQAFDDDRLLVFAIETPTQVSVPDEARRLLGVTDEPAPPYWWVELRCPILRPDAVDLAERIALAIAADVGGSVWRSPDPL